MRQLYEFVRDDIGVGLIGLLVTWAGIGWVYFRKRTDWSRKQFLNQVNFSLSYISDGKLTMRTLMESSAHEVWLNDHGVRQVVRAAEQTTPDQPFIVLDDPADMAFIHRAVLNVLSEKFAEAYIAQANGLPTRFTTYRFAVTCERFADVRTLKIRVLLATDDDLRETFAEGRSVEIPSKYYEPRLRTLRAMSRLFRTDGQPGSVALGRVILGLRT